MFPSLSTTGVNVLIETSWNVKRITVLYIILQNRINRNIVECKGGSGRGRKPQSNRINRNIVECKVIRD